MRFVLKTCLALCLTAFMCGCKNDMQTGEEPQTAGLNKAMYQEYLMTRDPQLNYVPKERLLVAQNTMRNLMAARVGSSINNMTWQERGPSNVGGRTRAIIVDKRDASGNTVFAASVSGGIFKTTSFLSNPPTWTPVNDKLQNLAINAMVQDPVNHNIMYAGTGEGWFNVDAVKGVGIFKSTDGGTTWNLLSSTTSFEYVQDMVIDNNGNVYATLRPGNNGSLSSGVVRSTNAGASWVQVAGLPLSGFTTGRAADLEVAANGDLYATLGIFSNTQVLKSSFSENGTNTGAAGTWINITPVTVNGFRADIAVAPSNPQRLYLAVQDKVSNEVKVIYRSSNAGVTWDSLPAPSGGLNNGINSQAWFNLIVQVDPNNPDIVLVGAYYISKSIDAGSNWSTMSTDIHVDQHVLHFINSSSLIVGNDGGMYHSANANSTSASFINKNNGYNVTQFYAADVHPTLPNYFLAGAQDNNTQKFTQPGINNTIVVTGGDGGFPHIDQIDPKLQISSYVYNNYFRSLDGGTTWGYLSAVSNDEGQFINPTDLDDNQKVLYAGHSAKNYYYIKNLAGTTPGNTPVGQVNTFPLSNNMFVTAVKVDPFNANTVWLGFSLGGGLPAIFKISNANTPNFSIEASSNIPSVLNAYISSIDIDPSNPDHMVVTLSNYGVEQVWESINGGLTWNGIKGNLPDMPVRWAIIAPTNAQLNGTTSGVGGIVIGTELGVWATSQSNGTSTQWLPQADVPNVRTDMLRYRPSDRLLLAATHGRGVWTTTIPTGNGTNVSNIQNTKNFIKYINATPQQLNIKIGNLNTNAMQMRIFDINGRLVRTVDSRYADQSINISSLSSGSYIIKVFGNRNEQYTYRFIK